MINYKKQILALILGLALSHSDITLTGPYCTMEANAVPVQNKEKFLKICNNIDKLNKILKETSIHEYTYIDEENREETEYTLDDGYAISERYFIDLITQKKQDKVRDYLNSYKKELNNLFSFSNVCDEFACYHDVKASKNEILKIFRELEKSVSDYFKTTK